MKTIFNTLPSLNGKRLQLTSLSHKDWKSVSYLRTDAEINKYVNRPAAATKEEALAFIDRINEEIATGKILYWAISVDQDQEMIGSICLWNFSSDRKTAELGYDLMPSHQKKGIMDEAVKLVMKHADKTLCLDHITAHTHRDNISSRKLLKRNDFIYMPDATDSNPNNVIYLRSIKSNPWP